MFRMLKTLVTGVNRRAEAELQDLHARQAQLVPQRRPRRAQGAAVVGDEIYLRGKSNLYCIAERSR